MKVGEIDLTGQNRDEAKVIYTDRRLQLQEEINELWSENRKIWEAMIVDHGEEEHTKMCARLREIARLLGERGEEINEMD